MNLTMASEQAAKTGTTVPVARIVSGVKVYGTGATAVRALDGVPADFGAGRTGRAGRAGRHRGRDRPGRRAARLGILRAVATE